MIKRPTKCLTLKVLEISNKDKHNSFSKIQLQRKNAYKRIKETSNERIVDSMIVNESRRKN